MARIAGDMILFFQDATNNPQVIYRKDGKKRDLQAEKKSKEEEEAKKAALAAKYKEWNKG